MPKKLAPRDGDFHVPKKLTWAQYSEIAYGPDRMGLYVHFRTPEHRAAVYRAHSGQDGRMSLNLTCRPAAWWELHGIDKSTLPEPDQSEYPGCRPSAVWLLEHGHLDAEEVQYVRKLIASNRARRELEATVEK